jgi:hypothetical protein
MPLTTGIWNAELPNAKKKLKYYSAASVNLLSEIRVGWNWKGCEWMWGLSLGTDCTDGHKTQVENRKYVS